MFSIYRPRRVIAGPRHVPAYAAQLTEMRLKNVIITDLGWRFWHLTATRWAS